MTEVRGAEIATLRRDDPDDVVARLEEDIIFGRLAPGARLTEDALMSRYGTSRPILSKASRSIRCGVRFAIAVR